jgi:hypothetical protein
MLVEIKSEILAPMDLIQTHSIPNPDEMATENSNQQTVGDDVAAEPKAVRPRRPGPRREVRLKRCRDALTSWRRTFSEQNSSDSAQGPRVLMSNTVINKLATRAHLQTVEDVQREIPEWDFAKEHGADALAIIKEVDDAWKQEHEREKQERKEKRKKISLENKRLREEKRREERYIATLRRRAAALQPVLPYPYNIPHAGSSTALYYQQYAAWYYAQPQYAAWYYAQSQR